MKRLLTIALLSGLLIVSAMNATEKRVGQIPNGNKFKCQACHVSAAGGGSRNSFGKAIETGFLNGSGNVNWGPALAALDSDNDGFTNGAELGDPDGSWKIGNAAPGIFASISNPGNPASKPPTNDVENVVLINRVTAFPNPAMSFLSVNYILTDASIVRFDFYNILGELIYSSANSYIDAGTNTFTWDTNDNSGAPVPSGRYILALRASHTVLTEQIIINR